MKKFSLKICLLIAILFCALVYIGEYEAPMEIKGVELASDLPECPRFGKWHNCFGAYNDFNGNKYIGEWKDNEWHGKGTAISIGGSTYAGEYKNVKRNGNGTYTWGPNSEGAGEKYVGEYRDRKRNGQGAFTYANGSKYVGEYKDGIAIKGTHTLADGNKYDGEFKDQKKHG